MPELDNITKARIAKLKKQADELGITYQEEVEEETLKIAISEAKSAKETPAVAAATVAMDATAIGEIVKTIKHSLRPDTIEDGIVSEADADPNDEAPEKVYFHPALFWVLPHKVVGGQRIKPPFRKLIFEKETGSSVRNGDQWNTRYLSALRSTSKREQAYIDTHPSLNRDFYTDAAKAMEMNKSTGRGMIFSKCLQQLATTQAKDLYRMAASYGIATSMQEGLGPLRARIADAMADKEIERKEAENKRVMAGQGRPGLLQAAR